ncbi:MAG: glycosyltransferase, partial [Candidatus Latescibacterota bacterium]
IRRLPYRALVYEAIDALASNPKGVSRDYAASEAQILRAADLVIASSQTLHAEKAPHTPRTHWIPSGVADVFFRPAAPAPEVMEIPGPRLGFCGTLDHRLDQPLLRDLAQRRPEWSFVLIGPRRSALDEVLAAPNVHWLDARPHGELPGYLAALDVLFLPYVLDDFTRHVYPAKIHECLALGKPVVATALPSLEPFAEVVRLVGSMEEFESALAAALWEDDPQLRQRRVDLARQNAWETRYQEIRCLLDEVLSGAAAGEMA